MPVLTPGPPPGPPAGCSVDSAVPGSRGPIPCKWRRSLSSVPFSFMTLESSFPLSNPVRVEVLMNGLQPPCLKTLSYVCLRHFVHVL